MDYKRLTSILEEEIDDENEKLAAELICRSYLHLNIPKREDHLFDEVNKRGSLSKKWTKFDEHEKRLYFRQALESLVGLDALRRQDDGLYELV